jgi:hypothetical protein
MTLAEVILKFSAPQGDDNDGTALMALAVEIHQLVMQICEDNRGVNPALEPEAIDLEEALRIGVEAILDAYPPEDQ